MAGGAGGTGLGGASSGATQAYYGQNVAGTIGGRKATGWGQWLTGTDGGVAGLKLQITSPTTGSKGVVKVSEGFASRLANYTSSAIDADNGLLTNATAAITDQITSLTDDADRMQASVKDYTEQMQLKFATMEGVVAKNKSLLSYLTAQVTSLQGLSVDTNA
ncbi:MAG: flagellar filament capping protein FliD [Armatimonadota bacterium]